METNSMLDQPPTNESLNSAKTSFFSLLDKIKSETDIIEFITIIQTSFGEIDIALPGTFIDFTSNQGNRDNIPLNKRSLRVRKPNKIHSCVNESESPEKEKGESAKEKEKEKESTSSKSSRRKIKEKSKNHSIDEEGSTSEEQTVAPTNHKKESSNHLKKPKNNSRNASPKTSKSLTSLTKSESKKRKPKYKYE